MKLATVGSGNVLVKDLVGAVVCPCRENFKKEEKKKKEKERKKRFLTEHQTSLPPTVAASTSPR